MHSNIFSAWQQCFEILFNTWLQSALVFSGDGGFCKNQSSSVWYKKYPTDSSPLFLFQVLEILLKKTKMKTKAFVPVLLHKTSGSGDLTWGLLKTSDYLGVCNRVFLKIQLFPDIGCSGIMLFNMIQSLVQIIFYYCSTKEVIDICIQAAAQYCQKRYILP